MDGTITLLSKDAAYVRTKQNHKVLLMYGLLTGDIHSMRSVVDNAMSQIFEGEKLECLVLTWFPSFRIPDPVLRYCFSHIKQYSNKIQTIYFLDFPLVKRTLFKTVCRLLPESLACLVKLTSSSSLDELLGITLPRVLPVPVCKSKVSNHTNEECFTFIGKKKGSGGKWGNETWKPKTFHASPTHFWYRDKNDKRIEGEFIPLVECKVLSCTDRELVFSTQKKRFIISASTFDLENFCTILNKDFSKKTADVCKA